MTESGGPVCDPAPGAGADELFCPSAQPDMARAEVLGVIDRSGAAPRLAYLEERVPVSGDVLALSGQTSPTRVMRFAAQCEERSCRHFDGMACKLAHRITEGFAPVVDRPPPCLIRPTCRWYVQEGKAACLRCPQVITETSDSTAEWVAVAVG